MDYTIDELTALVFQHSRRAIQARKAATEMLKLAAEDDRLAQVYLEAGKRMNREREAKEGKMNIRKIISGVMVLVLMVCLLSVSSFTLAQDEPGATVEATVEAPVDGTQGSTSNDTSAPKDNTAIILDALKEFALIAALIVLAFKAAGLVPPDVLDKALARGFDLARGLADTTPTPIDNRILEIAQPILSKLINDELAKRDAMPNILHNAADMPFATGSTIKPADLTAEG